MVSLKSNKTPYLVGLNILLGIILFSSTQHAFSKEHTVKAVGMKWKPEILVINKGDSVKFVGMIGHDTQSMEELSPQGYTGWKSNIGEEGFIVNFDEKGVYFHKCNPHVNAGMFGAILVSRDIPQDEFKRLSINTKAIGIGGPAVRKIFKKVEKKINSRVVASAD
mgnify:CR=1 FL=1